MFFTDNLIFITIFVISLFLIISIYLKKRKSCEIIVNIAPYFSFFCVLLCICAIVEISLLEKLNYFQKIIYETEIFVVLCVLSLLFFMHYKKSLNYIPFLSYFIVIMLISHIIISSAFLTFQSGTLVFLLIVLIIYFFVNNFNEYKKRAYLIIALGLYVYISILFNRFILLILTLCIIIVILPLGYRTIYKRIIHLYHTTTTLIYARLFARRKTNENYAKKRPLFWLAKIHITQIAKKNNEDQKKIRTFLEDYFKKKNIFRLKITINKDNFRICVIIKAKTEKECIEKGNKVLTHFKASFNGLDGHVKYIPVTPQYLYFKKEKWWVLKFPKAPYEQQIELINYLSTLFGEKRNKVKLYIMWKKAPQKKVLLTRAKIIAMKNKDMAQKNIYLKMWREDLFSVKIYINYEVSSENIALREQDILEMKGIIKSLEIPAKNAIKQAKIKRTLCGARADFLKGNLFNTRYLTPITFDFTFSDKMPLYIPIALRNQTINREYYKNKPSVFPVGKWIDEEGRKRDVLQYVSVDHFVQGACIIGQMNTGKTYLMSHIIKSINEKKPGTGVLVFNFKREYEENIYSAEKFYRFGKNLKVPYFITVGKEKLSKEIEETAKCVMGALGFEEESVYACKDVLQRYMEQLGAPPESIVELLETVREYFTVEEHNYDDKFRSRIMSALSTRINAHLSDPILINTLTPNEEIGQWYKDWKSGKIVQIDLASCNEWEQRLIAILILQTIKILTPESGAEGLRYLIVIDEAHRILKKMESIGKYKSDDYIACEQIEKIFALIFSEFRDRGISFLLADQRANILHESAIELPSLKFLMRQSNASVEKYSKNPQHIEVITHLPNRYCVLDNGATGEFFSFVSMDFRPEPFNSNYTFQEEENKFQVVDHDYNLNTKDSSKDYDSNEDNSLNLTPPPSEYIKKVVCPNCESIVSVNSDTCPSCGYLLNFELNQSP